jgi:hypothetical protein
MHVPLRCKKKAVTLILSAEGVVFNFFDANKPL